MTAFGSMWPVTTDLGQHVTGRVPSGKPGPPRAISSRSLEMAAIGALAKSRRAGGEPKQGLRFRSADSAERNF